MKFEQKYTIGIREINLKNQLSNYGILAFLEDIATSHSNTVGYGVKDVPIKKGAWLLMDWQLEVKNRPAFDETITVKTYAVSSNKPSYHSYRNFELYDKNNNLIATATSKWLFYNFEQRKIVKLDEEMLKLFEPEGDLKKVEEKITKLKEPTSYEKMIEYQVRRENIDVNKHMNNLVYLKLANEILPDEVYFGNELNNLRINYKHQIRLGETVKIYYTMEDNKHIITIKNKDESKIHAIVEMY